MTDKRKALGRGLEALLPSSKPAVAPAPAPNGSQSATRELSLDLIERNPFQTRFAIAEAELNELAESIKASGVLQPILVRPLPNGRFQVMAGERRCHAAKRAGKQTIPALIKQASDQQAMEITIIENLQREDINALDQAKAFDRLAREFGLTQEQIAVRTGKERATVANFLRLLKLPEDVQAKVQTEVLSMGHAKALLPLEDAEAIRKAAAKIEAGAWSVRQAEDYVRSLLAPESKETKPAAALDPNVKQAAFELQSALGCKVEIRDRRGKGKIIIAYKSLEDFDRVMAAVTAKA